MLPNHPSFDDEVQRALQIQEAADDVSFSPRELAIICEIIKPNFGDLVLNGLKRAMPFVRSRGQKLKQTQQSQDIRDQRMSAEQRAAIDLDTWFEELSTTEQQNIRVTDLDYGDLYMSELAIETTRDGELSSSFYLGHHFGTDSVHFDKLPPAVQKRLLDRADFWRSLGADSGEAIEEFIEEHFEKIAIDFSSEDTSTLEELRWLRAADSTLYDEVQSLQADTGRAMYLWRLKKSPEIVINNVLQVAINSQEKYITTWLEDFTKHNRLPHILPTDVEAITIARDAIKKELAKRRTKSWFHEFKRALRLHELEQQADADMDFLGSLKNIQRLRSIVLGLEIEGVCNEKQLQVMERVNVLLDEELSGERVAQRLMVDTAVSTSEGIMQAMKVLSGVGFTAEILEHIPVPFIAALAKAVGSFDDFAGEFGEVVSLHARGFKWEEIMKRGRIVIPIGILAVAIGGTFENYKSLIDHGTHGRVAALLFATTSFATTAATLGLTMHSFVQGYDKLAQQGKLEEKTHVSADKLDEHLVLPAKRATAPLDEEAATEITQRLEALSAKPNISQRDLESFLRALEAKARSGLQTNAQQHGKPSRKEAYAAAFQEVFLANPAYGGRLAAIPVMLVSAALLGDILLSNPLLYAPFGMLESFMGMGFAHLAAQTENTRWRSKAAKHTANRKQRAWQAP